MRYKEIIKDWVPMYSTMKAYGMKRAKHPDGSIGRGIQYPFIQPKAGEYHENWHLCLIGRLFL